MHWRWQQQNGYQVNRLQDARKLGIFSQDLHQRKACSFQTNSIRDASKSVTYDSVRLKCSNRDPHCTNVAPMHSTNQLLTTSLPSSRRQHEAYGTRVKPAFHSSIQVGENNCNDELTPSELVLQLQRDPVPFLINPVLAVFPRTFSMMKIIHLSEIVGTSTELQRRERQH